MNLHSLFSGNPCPFISSNHLVPRNGIRSDHGNSSIAFAYQLREDTINPGQSEKIFWIF